MALIARFSLKLPAIPLLHPAQARTILSREVGTAVTGIVEEIAADVRANTPVGATGIARAAVATRVMQGIDARVLVQAEVYTGRQAPYWQYIEEGRAPGKTPPWGEGSNLRLWVQRVVGDISRTFVIARAIGRRGIRARHIFRNALARIRPTIQPRVQAAVDRAARLLGGR
jgi:hypothetical protein